MIIGLKTFWFNQKNGNGSLVLSQPSYEEAEKELAKLVKDPNDWTVEDEIGEGEFDNRDD